MIDINHIYTKVKISPDEALSKLIESYVKDMIVLAHKVPKITKSDISEFSENYYVVKQNQASEVISLNQDELFANGQIQGLYFKSRRSVSE